MQPTIPTSPEDRWSMLECQMPDDKGGILVRAFEIPSVLRHRSSVTSEDERKNLRNPYYLADESVEAPDEGAVGGGGNSAGGGAMGSRQTRARARTRLPWRWVV